MWDTDVAAATGEASEDYRLLALTKVYMATFNMLWTAVSACEALLCLS